MIEMTTMFIMLLLSGNDVISLELIFESLQLRLFTLSLAFEVLDEVWDTEHKILICAPSINSLNIFLMVCTIDVAVLNLLTVFLFLFFILFYFYKHNADLLT